LEPIIQFELSKEYLDKLNEAIANSDVAFIRETMDGVNPNDITAVLEEFNPDDSKYVIDQLEREVGAEIISSLEEDTRKVFLKKFSNKEVAQFLEYLDSDDAADILNELPLQAKRDTFNHIKNEEKAEHILELLRYDEDSAGGLMAKEFIKANVNWKVKHCIEEIRRQAENVEKVYSVYVVDDRNHLLGTISLKKLLLADDDKKIEAIYNDDVISVITFVEATEVAAIIQKYDLDALPVVNVHGKLVGRITVDDIIDVITESADQERQMMAGIAEDVEEDDSLWVLTRARLPWLIIGMIGGIFGARIIGIFEGDILRLAQIAFFIPLIGATGGNVGIQSSSIIVQSLANKSVFEESTFNRLMKVLGVAIINGVVLGVIVFGISYMVMDSQDFYLAGIVAISLFLVVILASFTGTITPLILDKFDINPAIASGPFITTANDLLGLGIYFSMVHFMYPF